MTLYESTDGLEKLESNGVIAYIDPKLLEYLNNIGNINVDFISTADGRSGYAVSVGEGGCGDCKCPSGSDQ
jgi:Fe-S cluster assembly iron-binding protein IscA